MDKAQSISLFIKTNNKLLIDVDTFDWGDYKRIKQDFIKDRKIAGGFRDREVAIALVDKLINSGGITNNADLDALVDSNPFLKMNNIITLEFGAKIKKAKREFVDSEALRQMKDSERVAFLRRKIVEEQSEVIAADVKAEIEELDRQKELKEKELASILDTMTFEEPKSYEAEPSPQEWWELLNLWGNPFPNTNGLGSISEKLYEKILVTTESIHWMLDKLDSDNFDFFGKGFLVEGELGTGKTTFYDFFKPRFILKNIEPVRVIIPEKMGVALYNADFELQLDRKLKSIFKDRSRLSYDSNGNYEELMVSLQLDHDVKGFVIFIDDLHKHTNFDLVKGFLSSLQLYKNRLQDSGINASFFVSGFPNWRSVIQTDQKLNSFFDGSFHICMPEVTTGKAAEAIKKRLNAFSRNSERSFQLSQKFLNYVFSLEGNNKNIVGFRPYIECAKNLCETKQFDILGWKGEAIHADILSGIRLALEQNPFFKKAINNLIFAGGRISNETLHRGIDLVRHIYLQTIVNETDKQFEDGRNLQLLLLLKQSKLIIKSSFGKGNWKIHPELEQLNARIKKKFDFSLEDYLIQIYGTNYRNNGQKRDAKDEDVLGAQLAHYRNMIGKDTYATLEKLLSEYKTKLMVLPGQLDKHAIFSEDFLKLERVESIVYSLANLLLEIESPQICEIYGKESCKNWTVRFRTLEYFLQFVNAAKQSRSEYEFNEETRARVIGNAIKAFEEVWKELMFTLFVLQYVDQRILSPFDGHFLNRLFGVMEFVQTSSLDSERFREIFAKFFEHVETIFKGYLFLASRLIFGNSRFNFYPRLRGIKTYSTAYEGPTNLHNDFASLERTGFKEIFIDDLEKYTEFVDKIVRPISEKFRRDDLEHFYRLFSDFDEIISHREQERSSELRRYVKDFLVLSCKLVREFTLRLDSLLFENSFSFCQNDKVFVAFGYRPSTKNQLDIVSEEKYVREIPRCICHHDITQLIEKDSTTFLEDFFTNGILQIDLADPKEMSLSVPGSFYPENMATLKYLLVKQEIIPLKVYGNSFCFKRKETKGEN